MSSALYIVAKKKPRDFDLLMDGKALAKAEEGLAPICTKLGTKRLMDFFSQNPEELADLLGEDVPNAPAEQWFDATEGLKVVRALVAQMETKPDSIPASEWVLEDLKQCERILVHLEQKKIPWHFALDI
jgi:hypothetical protein